MALEPTRRPIVNAPVEPAPMDAQAAAARSPTVTENRPQVWPAAICFLLLNMMFCLMGEQLGGCLDGVGLGGSGAPAPRRLTVVAAPPALALPPLPERCLDLPPAPGPVQVDGQTNDWDLGDGLLFTPDLARAAEQYLWLYAMWDAERVYFLARFAPPPPPALELAADAAPSADGLEVYLLMEQSITLQIAPGARGAAVALVTAGTPRLVPAAQASAAFRRAATGRGWTAEAAISRAALPAAVRFEPGRQLRLAARAWTGDESLGLADAAHSNPEEWARAYVLPQPIPPARGVIFGKGTLCALEPTADGPVVVPSRQVPATATENLELPALPLGDRSRYVDGNAADWDRSGGILGTDALSSYPDEPYCWLYAGYDPQRLYLCADVQDFSPMSRDRRPDDPAPWLDDCVQFRLFDGQSFTLTAWQETDQTPHLLLADTAHPLPGRDVLAAGGVLTIVKRPDYTGYLLKATVPWSLLRGDRPPPTAGERLPAWAAVTIAPGQQLVVLGQRLVTPERADQPETWGHLVLAAGPPAEPPPIITVIGQHAPVALIAGRPQTEGRFYAVGGGWTIVEDLAVVPTPGPVKIDGEFTDWDLSGGVYACPDVYRWRGLAEVWLHAMYDRDQVYLLARYRDLTPLQHTVAKGTSGRYGHENDCLQFRFAVDRGVHATAWRDRTGRPVMDISYGYWGHPMEPGLDDALAAGARQAFHLDADGRGYTQELAVPWRLLTRRGTPLAAGATCGFTFEGRFDWHWAVFGVTRWYGQRAAVYNAPQDWGRARFMAGPVTAPGVVRLADGRSFPMRLASGIPEVDWTGLGDGRTVPRVHAGEALGAPW